MQLVFAAPAALFALLAVPLLVIANLLMGRRRDVVVANLMIWEKLAGQMSLSESRSRRLAWLKLLAEIALFLTLTVSAAGPKFVRGETVARRVVVVLDNGVRMNTRLPEGGSAWDAAVLAAGEVLSDLDAADRVAVVLQAGGGETTARWTGPEEAARACAGAEVATVHAPPGPAIQAALALAPDATVVHVSLGQPGAPAPPERVVRVHVGGEISDNLGWLRGGAAGLLGPDRGQRVRVFGVLASASETAREAQVEVRCGDQTQVHVLAVPARGEATLDVTVDSADAPELTLRVLGEDSFAADDQLTARRGRPAAVQIRAGADADLSRLLALLPEVSAGDEPGQRVDIWLGGDPLERPTAPEIVVAPKAGGRWGALAGPAEGLGPIARTASDPLLDGLDLSQLRPGVGVRVPEERLRGLGLNAIAWAPDGTVLIARGPRRIFVAFGTSGWRHDPSFPSFWRRAIRLLAPGSGRFVTTIAPLGATVTDNRGGGPATRAELPDSPAQIADGTALDLRPWGGLLGVVLLLAYGAVRCRTKRR